MTRDCGYADEYANQAAKLLERDADSYPLTVERRLGGQLEALRGIGYAVLAAREEFAVQLADLSDAVVAVADQVSDVEDRVLDVETSVCAAAEIVALAVQPGGIRGWLRSLFRRAPSAHVAGDTGLDCGGCEERGSGLFCVTCGRLIPPPLRDPGRFTAGVPAVLAVLPGTDVYARLDGLRACLRKVLADDTRDPVAALALAAGDLEEICEQAPVWCPGCKGRGDGLSCAVCGAPVPAALRHGGEPR